jgi:acetyltransferase EpsM
VAKLQKLIIIGGGEHATCVYEAAMLSEKFEVMGFFDVRERIMGAAPYLGGDDLAANHPDAAFIVGVGMIGPGRERALIVERLSKTIGHWATVIHPCAIVAPSARIGRGVLIMPGAIINAGAVIGNHCIINTGVTVEHDCEIGPFSHLCPGVIMGGGVKIGQNSMVGLGSRIRDHISIGSQSFVAMGSVVTRSFPDASRLLGSPATPGWDFG